MSEALVALHGALAAFSLMGVGAAWFLAYRAERSVRRAKSEADASVTLVREAASGIVESHNAIVRTQAEQGATLERLSAEVAGRAIRR